MATKTAASRRNGSKPPVDPNTPAGLKAFKAAAASYTSKHTGTQAAASAALKRQGMLTPTGKLSKRFAPS